MRAGGFRPALAGLVLFLAGGCAYEISQSARVIDSGRLARVGSVVVVPFRYEHDWTGYFRGIYQSAGITPPGLKKVDLVEASFLPEGALLKLGYEVRAWPPEVKKFGRRREESGAEFKKAMPALRATGAEAVLVIEGKSECPEIHHCVARVEAELLDTKTGELIWKSKARGATFLGHGNEMRAAVEEALGALPPPLSRR